MGSAYGFRHGGPAPSQKGHHDIWLIDSGASNHTTCNDKLFITFTRKKSEIRVANQNRVKVLGKGTVHIPEIGEINGVLYVPDIPYNVLATVKLSKETDIEIAFKGGEVHLSRNGEIIGSVQTRDGLPYLTPNEHKPHHIYTNQAVGGEESGEVEGVNEEDTGIKTETHKGAKVSIGKLTHDNCAHLLHRRLGHISFPIVQKMSECTEGLKVKNCENYLECSICKCSKIKAKPRPKKSDRTTNETFQLIHMDLVGPFRPSIRYGERFFLTIVDDFSRYGFVYTIKRKDEVFQRFKEFYRRVEVQHNTNIKQIMTDRGSEFLSNDFSRWLRERGIAHFTSSPFSAFQNGVSERRNGVLQTMARCALEDAGMGQAFWSEAIHYSNYTLNRLWSSVIDKTPYEVMHKRRPNLAHLHVFGVPADVHIPRQLRRKGDKVSRRMRFVGYEPGTKGYRFIDRNNKFVISRSAEFHEHFNWSKIHSNDIPSRRDTTVPRQEQANQSRDSEEETKTHHPKRQGLKTEEWKEGHPTLHIDQTTDEEDECPQEPDPTPSRPVRSSRNKRPKRFDDYILSMQTNHITPSSYNEIMELPTEEKEKWKQAMEKEMRSLKDLQVYTPAKIPEDKKPIGTRWVFKIKPLEDGKTLYKARLVAQGFAQKYPEDYTDTYSPTVRAESVKSALTIASILGLEVHQFDVQTAYLHADLDKKIYVKAPPGISAEEGSTWLLNKSLYGLKQSGKRWYDCLANTLKSTGFTATPADKCFFTRREKGSVEYVLVYVDDILYIGKQKSKCDNFANELKKHFSLKSLGTIDKYLGVHIIKTDKGFKLSQKEKIDELLLKCNMSGAKASETPMQPDFLKNMYNEAEPFTDNRLYRSTIGSLLYIANWTRPDIALAVNLLSRHVSQPTVYHWEATKRVLRYLKHSAEAYLNLEPSISKVPKLSCYADADWAGDAKTRKSTSGYIIFLNESPIHWYTGKQKLVATSTAEAEFACMSKAANNLTWFDDLLSNIWTEPSYPIPIHEDNKAAIEISKASAIGQRSRHIDIKYKHVRQLSEIGFIKAIHCDTVEQTADILTKPLTLKQHMYLTTKLHVERDPTSVRHLEGDLSGEMSNLHRPRLASSTSRVNFAMQTIIPTAPPYLDSSPGVQKGNLHVGIPVPDV